MQVGVLGVNHKSAHVDLREKLALVCERRLASNASVHGRHLFVPVMTCNRMEVYFSSEDLASTHSYLLHIFRREIEMEDFDHLLYSYFGEDCFTHLARVTAGLDSAVVGETEIQGQVKKAYETASNYQMLPQVLHFVFQKSLKIGKQIRSEACELSIVPSMEKIIFDLFRELLIPPKILFIGASQINFKVLNYLQTKNITTTALTNRSWEKGQKGCKGLDVTLIPWEEFPSRFKEFTLLVFGTKYPGHLLTEEMLEGVELQQTLIVDLSVPRNVDPALQTHPSVELWNVDQISHKVEEMRSKRLLKKSWAENRVESSIERQIHTYMKKMKVGFPLSLQA